MYLSFGGVARTPMCAYCASKEDYKKKDWWSMREGRSNNIICHKIEFCWTCNKMTIWINASV